MNIKRALGFSVLLYLASFIVYGIIQVVPALEFPSFSGYLVLWVLNIPIVLLLAKWYFKSVAPTAKRGLALGVLAIFVAVVFDGIFALIAHASGVGMDEFASMYTDWKFYCTIVEVLFLTSYAGFEFDGTYSGTK